MNDSSSLRDLFRKEVNDVVRPFLWDDVDEFFPYLDDAQKMFCRLSGGIGDATTPAITQIPVEVGVDWVDTDPRILEIRGCKKMSDGRDIEVINFQDMHRLNIRFDGREGPVQYLIIGLGQDKARLHPVPSQADTLWLIVDRLPLKDIDGEDQKLEIQEQHCINLLDWVKYRAYSKQDAEARDDKKAADHKAKFEAYCFQAKRERDRAKHKPRAINYGGIPIGTQLTVPDYRPRTTW